MKTKEGQWLNGDDYEYEFAYCSECGRMQWADWNSHAEAKEKVGEFHEDYKFCPGCGAKMTGGRYVEKKDKPRNRPTKKQVRQTVEVKGVVYLAHGYSDVKDTVWVRNFTEGTDIFEYPKFGNWKSFDEIESSLAKVIDKRYPSDAFPFLCLDKITLYRRNEDDREYLSEIGEFDA